MIMTVFGRIRSNFMNMNSNSNYDLSLVEAKHYAVYTETDECMIL